MIIYYHRDGSLTLARARTAYQEREDKRLELEAVRVVDLADDGSITVLKDRYGPSGQVLKPIPLAKVYR